MKRRALVLSSLGALLASAAGVVGLKRLAKSDALARRGVGAVSLSPALTETAFALGAAASLVGVSDYCELPDGLKLPRIGSSLTPNYESITALAPSLILCDDSAAAKRRELSALASCEFLPWLTLTEVTASTRRLGQLLGREQEANTLAQELQARLSQAPPPDAPRVLLLLSYDASRPGELWFIKRNSLHGAALSAAGARNAVDRDVPGLPRLGTEELLRLDPDAVLIIPPPGATAQRRQELVQAFNALSPLKAVRQRKVSSVSASHSVGPSILELVSALSVELTRLSRESAEASVLPG